MVEKSKRDYGPLDAVQEAMGVMGPWQIVIAIALSFVNIPVAWQQLSIAVTAPKTSFTCIIPESIAGTTTTSLENHCSYTTMINNVTISHECTDFNFVNEGLSDTMITQHKLVCGRSSLKNFVQAFTMLGILAGNMLFGTLADKYGRKIPLLVALILQVVTGLLCAIVPWFIVFAILKVISAVATGGTMLISFVLLMEVVGVEWRSTLSVLFHIPFVLGHMSTALIAYFTGTYFSYSLAISLPSMFLLSYYWLIPESPRWLLAAGKIKEAKVILEEAATRNNIPLEKVNAAIEFHNSQLAKETKDNDQNTFSMLDLFKTSNLRIRTICIAFNWLVCGFCFFGLAHYVSRLDDRIYYNIFISAAFELGGIMIVWIFIHRISRLKLLMSGNIVAGISLLVLTFVTGNAQVWIISVGCCAMSVSFTVVYLYSSELFPTVVRNAGIGLCSVCARIASTIVPFIATSGESSKNNDSDWIISVIFGVGPLIGAALCLLLPETMDCQLPETIEDGENFGKKTQSIPLDEEAK